MVEDFIKPVHPLDEIAAPPELLQNGNSEKLSQTPRLLAESAPSPDVDNTNRNFKGQQKNELVLRFSRKHWISLLPHFISFSVFILALVSFFLFVPQEAVRNIFSPLMYQIIAGIVILGLTYYLHHFFIEFFNYYLQILIITNFRVIQLDKTVYFRSDQDSVDVGEIQNIVVQKKGPIKTILNYGEIIITLSSAHATKIIQCVPNPDYYFRKINKTKRQYLISRQLEKASLSIQKIL